MPHIAIPFRLQMNWFQLFTSIFFPSAVAGRFYGVVLGGLLLVGCGQGLDTITTASVVSATEASPSPSPSPSASSSPVFEIARTDQLVWLKADSITGLAVGDTISTWTDQVSQIAFTPETPNPNTSPPPTFTGPTYGTETRSDGSSVSFLNFTGQSSITSDQSSFSSTLFSTSTSFSSFVVLKLLGNPTSNVFLWSKNANTGLGIAPQVGLDGSFLTFKDGQTGSGSPYTVQGTNINLQSTMALVYLDVVSSGSSIAVTAFVNGVAESFSVISTGAFLSSSPTPLRIGAAPDATGRIVGNIYEVLIYSAVQSESDYHNTYCSLAAKYGIAGSIDCSE